MEKTTLKKYAALSLVLVVLASGLLLRTCKTCKYGKAFPLCAKTHSQILSEHEAKLCLDYTSEEPTLALPRREVVGLQENITGLEWYQRNPISKVDEFLLTLVPHDPPEKRLTYACPTGKTAMVEVLQCGVYRDTAATAAGAARAFWKLTPKGGETTDSRVVLFSRIITNNVGDKDVQAIGATFTLHSGDVLDGWTWDTSAGGSIHYCLTYKVTEFDT